MSLSPSMGTRSVPVISFRPPALRRPSINPRSSVYRSPNFSADLPGGSGVGGPPRARWDSEAETSRSERVGSDAKFDFAADADRRYGFRGQEKRRKWWSEEDEEEDDGDDGVNDLFGLWEEPGTTDLVLKVLGTFGWIMPNIIMSSMLDTGDKGQDALIMALMLPLGQLVISLVVDRIQGSSGYTPNTRRQKRKRRPSARTASRTRRGNRTRKRSYQTTQERAAYRPWWEADGRFSKNGTKSSSKFGGWDELDEQVDNVSDFHELPSKEDENLKKESHVQLEQVPQPGKTHNG